MGGVDFTKMHGLGNDFVVIDARRRAIAIGEAEARAIADRCTGIGCDQVIVIEPPANGDAEAFMRIRNADGGEVAACGNGTRCVAALLMAESGRDGAVIETGAGLLDARVGGGGEITVDMGRPSDDWRAIPLAAAVDTLHLDMTAGPLADPVAVGIGNPHAVFFVADADRVALETYGPALEHHPLFPERANIGAAQLLSPERGVDRIRLRVWERGAGLTRACGTGACAALVAAHRRGLSGRQAALLLDGGRLLVEWRDDGHVLATGPAAVSFLGRLDLNLLAP
ncbi:MAG: diaminopimelate epimerase [Kiloniellales bacterium]